MFTGLIEEIGQIQKVQSMPGGKVFTISAHQILEDLKVDDSVAVSGVCLTATKVDNDAFQAVAVDETLQRSTLGGFRIGNAVNLERALRINDRLGGHIVQGHVDGIGRIDAVQPKGTAHHLRVRLPEPMTRTIIEKGSIAVEGISLTVMEVSKDTFSVAVIPHTWEHTTLNQLKIRSSVNIETDFLGKYVEKMLSNRPVKGKMDEAWLRSLGY